MVPGERGLNSLAFKPRVPSNQTAEPTGGGSQGKPASRGQAPLESNNRLNKKSTTRRDKNNGGRPRTKPTRHLPKSRS